MEDVIRQLIAMDQRARDAVKHAEAERDEVKKRISQEKAELHQRYLDRAQRRIERVRQAAQEESAWQKAELEQKGQAAQEALGHRFEANRAAWADELLHRCLQPGLTRSM